jgi:hypothetical protein
MPDQLANAIAADLFWTELSRNVAQDSLTNTGDLDPHLAP